jgi:hypothetical protein
MSPKASALRDFQSALCFAIRKGMRVGWRCAACVVDARRLGRTRAALLRHLTESLDKGWYTGTDSYGVSIFDSTLPKR